MLSLLLYQLKPETFLRPLCQIFSLEHLVLLLKLFISLWLFNIIPMELGSILQFLENKSILVTGATGFLAKSICIFFMSLFSLILSEFPLILYRLVFLIVLLHSVFLEKVLRVQPNVKKLYLLLRAADAKAATHRFHNEVCINVYIRIMEHKYT